MDLAQGVRTSVLGRVIVVTAVVGTVVALALVERVGETYEGGLAVTERSAVLVADAVEPLQVLAADVAALVDTVVDELAGYPGPARYQPDDPG